MQESTMFMHKCVQIIRQWTRPSIQAPRIIEKTIRFLANPYIKFNKFISDITENKK